MITNIHPVDELHDVRAQIKSLEEREAELRARLLAGDCSLAGDSYTARIGEWEMSRLDAKAAREALGAATLAPFMRTRRVQQVWLARRK